MRIANEIAKSGTCSRLKVGAVLVKDNRIISTGYNGSAEGLEHCDHFDAKRCHKSVHAEMNCIAFAARYAVSTLGTTMYTNYAPCGGCSGPMINAGIIEVHYLNDYRSDGGLRSFKEKGIKVIKHEPESEESTEEYDARGHSSFYGS